MISRPSPRYWIAALLAALACAAPAARGDLAPATRAAPASAPAQAAGPYENLPIGQHGRDDARPDAQADGSTTAPAAGTAGQTGLSPTKVSLALLAVLALVFALQWVWRRVASGHAIAGGRGAVRVVSRTPLGPRQQLILIHVGRRLVLVANNGSQANALCEISDPDEVAALIGHADGDGGAAGRGGMFRTLLGRAQGQFDSGIDPTPLEDMEGGGSPRGGAAAMIRDHAGEETVPTETSEKLSDLREKVRRLSQQFEGR